MSGFVSVPAPGAPCIAPGGTIGIPPIPPRGGVADSGAFDAADGTVGVDVGTVPADGVGGGPSNAVGVV
ncbi:hypothetical protein, partial [Mycobacterium riyadhense]